MKSLKMLTKYLKDNGSELYTLLIIVIAIPFAVALLTSVEWALLLSFTLQALIGVLYIRGKSK